MFLSCPLSLSLALLNPPSLRVAILILPPMLWPPARALPIPCVGAGSSCDEGTLRGCARGRPRKNDASIDWFMSELYCSAGESDPSFFKMARLRKGIQKTEDSSDDEEAGDDMNCAGPEQILRAAMESKLP